MLRGLLVGLVACEKAVCLFFKDKTKLTNIEATDFFNIAITFNISKLNLVEQKILGFKNKKPGLIE
ncbi:MAG TPA: hypothetical protein VK528_09080 [Flavobacterium sp.]|nr:hypothetical protein [Flavobacterium sp.]